MGDENRHWDGQQWLHWDGKEWVPVGQPSSVKSVADVQAARGGKALGVVATTVVILVVLGVGAALVVGWQYVFRTKATFTSTIVEAAPLNPGAVGFIASVTNNGPETATYECTVTIESPGGAYRGFDIFTSKSPLAANTTDRFTGSVIVTGNGARYATSKSIKCVAK